jgi:hypothetical protein
MTTTFAESPSTFQSSAFTARQNMTQGNAGLHEEGPVAKAIENQTARLPSDLFLWGAMGVAGLSCALHCVGEERNSRFFGQWVAPFLIMGLYNKLVKVAGNERQSRPGILLPTE